MSFDVNNPLLEAIALTAKGGDIELFAPQESSFESKAYLLCSIEAIHEAFVKKHSIFTQAPHPFKETSSFLSPIGLKVLRLPNTAQLQDAQTLELDRWLTHLQKDFFTELSLRDKSFNLYYELSLLSLNFALKFLFNYSNPKIAIDFLHISLEFEGFLTNMRRGTLTHKSEDELVQMKQDIFLRQAKTVTTILQTLGIQCPTRPQIRAFIRTVLNSYVGTATNFFWMVHLLENNSNARESLSNTPKDSLVRAFIDEGLRLYPSAWMMTRVAEKNSAIAGVNILKGDAVHVCIYSLHRDKRYWNNPEDFLLQRFLDKSNKAFIPFGIGPRRCVGSQYAYYILEKFLKNYINYFKVDFSKAEKYAAIPQVALQPFPDPKVTVKIK